MRDESRRLVLGLFFEVGEGHLGRPLSGNVLCDPASQASGSDFMARVPLNAGADGEVAASLETKKAKPTRETQQAHRTYHHSSCLCV